MPLSEKNKKIRELQRRCEKASRRVKIFYPSYFVKKEKRRVPYVRKPVVEQEV